jgi:hypothetical protein
MADVPEADAYEQSQEVDKAERIDPVSRDPEVPEADALEQAIEVPEDEHL